MTLYESLLGAVTTEYDTLRVLKESPRGTVSVVRHKKSGTRYIFRRYTGSGEVYRRLLPVLCPHLPQIMEAAEQDGQTAVLEPKRRRRITVAIRLAAVLIVALTAVGFTDRGKVIDAQGGLGSWVNASGYTFRGNGVNVENTAGYAVDLSQIVTAEN